MDATGDTTLIRRFRDDRAEPDSENLLETTSTLSVMLRVLPPPRLLLLIEEPSLRESYRYRLDSEMLQVETVEDDETALGLHELEPFHILITDSLEFVRRLRACPSEPSPVVLVVLDGRDDEDERVQAIRAGADDCLPRRVHDEELQSRVGLARRIAELETVLTKTLSENRRLVALDDLTGVASRRFFAQHFPREVERAARYARPLALILCDIDHFKLVNDTRGHAAGDEVLRQFGARLRKCLRTNVDWIARLGGEEFAVVLPETSHEAAAVAARKLRAAVSDLPFPVDGAQVRVTASFGLCSIDLVPRDAAQVTDRLLRAADAALYRSKDAGRNRVTLASISGEGEAVPEA
jgi:diguanylate cyclase (GGDEF)-like protein